MIRSNSGKLGGDSGICRSPVLKSVDKTYSEKADVLSHTETPWKSGIILFGSSMEPPG